VGTGARRAHERPAQEPCELVPEQLLETGLGSAALSADHALDGRAMLEDSRGSTLVPWAAVAYGDHVRIIDRPLPGHDPWRE
jgi:hypothetical protein